ncbi:MAG: STAS domain-containing protein [SAR324 cluster bacterium]|nr:STAS domain-containing protein [SAR324 cluster bacterium]
MLTLTHRIEDNVCLVSLAGKLILGEERGFTEYLNRLLDSCQYKGIVLNFKGLQVIDSAGLGSIIWFMKKIKNQQKGFSLCQLSDQVSNTFKLTQLDQMLPIHDTEADALSSFATG